jgi:transposase
MGRKPYSDDLRSRVVAEVATGSSRREAARIYRVSVSSAIRWTELHDETGSVSPRRRGGKSRSPLEPHAAWLLELVCREADLTLEELAERIFKEVHLSTTERSIRRFFERHDISLKKKDSARSRAEPSRRG